MFKLAVIAILVAVGYWVLTSLTGEAAVLGEVLAAKSNAGLNF